MFLRIETLQGYITPATGVNEFGWVGVKPL